MHHGTFCNQHAGRPAQEGGIGGVQLARLIAWDGMAWHHGAVGMDLGFVPFWKLVYREILASSHLNLNPTCATMHILMLNEVRTYVRVHDAVPSTMHDYISPHLLVHLPSGAKQLQQAVGTHPRPF